MVSRSKSKNDARLARLSSTSAYSAANFSTLSPAPVESKKLLSFGSSRSMLVDNSLQPIEHDDLKQGSLYIVKIRNVSVALFQGWDDDMCCFAVLRSDSTPMRWSEARYIPGDFDAYDAFDDAGNPPVHLWTRHLRVNVPTNWFSIFEEARRKQRDWVTEQNQEPYYYPTEEHNGNGYPSSAVNNDSNSSSNNSKNNGETPQENDKEKAAKKAYAAGEEESKDEQASANGDKAPSSGSSESDEKEPVTPAVTDNDAHPVSNNGSSVVNSSVVAKETAAATAPPPVPKSFEAGEMTRLFTVSNIGFPHNGDQFSIQSSGYQQEAPLGTPTPTPLNGHSKKDAADGSNNAIKTKRRSVHSLFRGSK